MTIIEIINSVLRSIVFAYVIIYCIDEKIKVNKLKLISMTIMFIISGSIFIKIFRNNMGISMILTHILALVITIAFYRKNIIKALTSYTIIYSVIMSEVVLFGNLIFECVKKVIPPYYINYERIFLVYIPQWLVIALCLRYVNKLKQIYKLLIDEKFSLNALIMSFMLDFIMIFFVLTLDEKSKILNIVFSIFFVAVSAYFWKIHEKSNQIYKLNLALEIKNNELRKIKHDYGAQISYLYGLHLMGRFDDLKKSLKGIIDNNESIPTAVSITKNEKSVLSHALKAAIDAGIHVIIDESCDIKLINMDEMEFFKTVSNIVNNSIKVMNSEGIIIAKSYEYLGNAIIKIENNGPRIAEHDLKNIFKVGCSDKEKCHGYDLSLVKDLVERHSGKICIKSSDIATEFKIVVPIAGDA